jgi:hypothetical protein
MIGARGQASAEYAGLLAIIAVLGAALALTAGPPLIAIVGNALSAALGGEAAGPEAGLPTAADIADVESALVEGDDSLTPDAALVALQRRHPGGRAAGVAKTVLLAAARAAAPWLATRRTYGAWKQAGGSPYDAPGDVTGDRDVESPIGPPRVAWVTVAAQRDALMSAGAHHTSLATLALDAGGLIPGVRLVRAGTRVLRAGSRLVRAGARAERALAEAPRALGRVPRTVDRVANGNAIVALLNVDDDKVPAGLRAGDVVIAWPVRRTYWRDGRVDPTPRVELGATSSALRVRAYWHHVFLRPGAHGLAVIAEGFGA